MLIDLFRAFSHTSHQSYCWDPAAQTAITHSLYHFAITGLPVGTALSGYHQRYTLQSAVKPDQIQYGLDAGTELCAKEHQQRSGPVLLPRRTPE